jgi:hypothetical protein
MPKYNSITLYPSRSTANLLLQLSTMLYEKRLPEETHGLGWRKPPHEARRLLRPATRNTSHFQQIDPDLDEDLMISAALHRLIRSQRLLLYHTLYSCFLEGFLGRIFGQRKMLLQLAFRNTPILRKGFLYEKNLDPPFPGAPIGQYAGLKVRCHFKNTSVAENEETIRHVNFSRNFP